MAFLVELYKIYHKSSAIKNLYVTLQMIDIHDAQLNEICVYWVVGQNMDYLIETITEILMVVIKTPS